MSELESALQIRLAMESDADLVHKYIQKIAEYGDLAHEVSATVEDVRRALFGSQPSAQAIVAHWGGAPAGFALYTFTFASFQGKSGIFIENLFVEQAFRNKGVGKALLAHLARSGREMGCARLEWAVLNWNERAMEFYQDLGALPMDEWTTFRLTGDALERLAAQGEP